MVVLGRIVGPYGVRGWVHIHPFGDDPLAWKAMSGWWLSKDEGAPAVAWREYSLRDCRLHGDGLVACFMGIEDRNGAEALQGLYMGAPREALPKPSADEFYWVDLLGLEVVNAEGESYGTVVRLLETGANQVLVVHAAAGESGNAKNAAGERVRERLIPFIANVVQDVDQAHSVIRVAWGADW